MDDQDLGCLLINVNYKSSAARLQLTRYHTVMDLKYEITDKLNIPVSNQLIECWHKNPENDDVMLKECCEGDSIHLVVYNREENENNLMIDSRKDQYKTIQENNEKDTKVFETQVSCDFIEYFSTNYAYDDKKITLHTDALEDVINQAHITSLNNRRNVLLYFHNKQDPFAKIFCENISNSEIAELLHEHYFILGWDIENKTYHESLKDALLKHSELSGFTEFIEYKRCAALIIVPIRDSIMLLACMGGKISQEDFIKKLEQGRDFLRENQVEHDLMKATSSQDKDFGSVVYQQLMLDMLGDRDYDGFEHYEFDPLKKKIGYALFGPPKDVKGYDKKEMKRIETIFKVIVQQNNIFAKWKDHVVMSIIYNCTEPLPSEKKERSKKYEGYNPKTDLTPIPIFVLRKCKNSKQPCRVFIDDTCRVYASWEGYLKNNKLGKCEMILPKGGRYEADENGNVILEKHLSPACGTGEQILKATDVASTAVGLASGGVFVAAAIPAIAVAPAALVAAAAAGIGVGVYSIGRSAYTLIDRSIHKESLSFANSESRGAYINIVAGALGFVGAGANVAVSQLAARGVDIGKGAVQTVNVLALTNITVSGVSVVNSGYDVLDQWLNENQAPSLLTIVQLSSSILFFGHAVYNFKPAGAIIEEAQARTLQDYQENLRSNRHRKTFTKLVKETVRQNNHDVAAGQAEVIKTIRNIGSNKDDVFAALTRNNKAMNKNGVRFSAANGAVTLNGVQIDINAFAAMDKSETITFLTNLPNTPQPSNTNVSNMSSKLTLLFDQNINRSKAGLAQLSLGLLIFFAGSDQSISDKIINAVASILNRLLKTDDNLFKKLDEIFPNHRKVFEVMNMVINFFQNLVDLEETKYEKWSKSDNKEGSEEPYFKKLSLDKAQRAIQLFNIVSEIYFVGVNPTEIGIRKLLQYFYTWFAKQLINVEENKKRKEKRAAHSGSPAHKEKCPDCGGEYYHP